MPRAFIRDSTKKTRLKSASRSCHLPPARALSRMYVLLSIFEFTAVVRMETTDQPIRTYACPPSSCPTFTQSVQKYRIAPSPALAYGPAKLGRYHYNCRILLLRTLLEVLVMLQRVRTQAASPVSFTDTLARVTRTTVCREYWRSVRDVAVTYRARRDFYGMVLVS